MEIHRAKRAKIEVLDTKIHREEAALHQLRLERNDCTSISILHPELLSLIFRYHVFVHEEPPPRMQGRYGGLNSYYDLFPRASDTSCATYAPARSAVRLTHVCRHWRAVAREDASLWAQPLMTSEKWTWRMLERSKGAVLKVTTNLAGDFVRRCRDHNVRAARAALQHLHRISDLTLSLNGNDDRIKPIVEQLTHPAPMLTSLRLNHVLASRTLIHRSDVLLPDTLFGGTPPPRLKKLTLLGYRIPWSSHMLRCSSLVHLDISHGGDRSLANMGHMQTALAGLPCLQALFLHDTLPSSDDGARKLSLPLLRRLNLADDLERCITFLRNLVDVPPSASVCVHGVGAPGQPSTVIGENALHLYRLLAPFAKETRALHVEGSNSSIHDPFFARIYCWSSAVPMDNSNFPDVTTEAKVIVSILSRSGSSGGFLCPTVVEDVLEHLVEGTIESFSCNAFDRDGYHLDRWALIFARLFAVQNLRVNAQMLAIFLNAALLRPVPSPIIPPELTTSQSNETTIHIAPPTPIPLPILHHLILCHTLVTPVLHTKLTNLLTSPLRKPHLTSLRIARSAIRESHLAHLRTLVPTVDFESSAPLGISATFFGDDLVQDMRAEVIESSRWIQALSMGTRTEPLEVMNPFADGEVDF